MRNVERKLMLYDISPAIDGRLKVWPGDTPPTREVLCDLRRGDSVTLSTLRMSVHGGSHADAPSHYGVDAPSIEQRDLELFIGPCEVIRARVERGARVRPEDLSREVSAERVLICTGTYPDPANFNEDFAALSVELVDHLHARGVRLVGIDTPSVDLFSSKDLPAHKRILQCDMAILEVLVLANVPEGRYELMAAPLKLVGFDGSPVRAVLRGM